MAYNVQTESVTGAAQNFSIAQPSADSLFIQVQDIGSIIQYPASQQLSGSSPFTYSVGPNGCSVAAAFPTTGPVTTYFGASNSEVNGATSTIDFPNNTPMICVVIESASHTVSGIAVVDTANNEYVLIGQIQSTIGGNTGGAYMYAAFNAQQDGGGLGVTISVTGTVSPAGVVGFGSKGFSNVSAPAPPSVSHATGFNGFIFSLTPLALLGHTWGVGGIMGILFGLFIGGAIGYLWGAATKNATLRELQTLRWVHEKRHPDCISSV